MDNHLNKAIKENIRDKAEKEKKKQNEEVGKDVKQSSKIDCQ